MWNENSGEDERVKKPLGLMGMIERAALVGGRVEIRSEVNRGTTVEAVIPLPQEDQSDGKN